MNNDINIAIQESEAQRMAQAAKRQEVKDKQEKRKEFAKDAAQKRKVEQEKKAKKVSKK